MTRTAKDAETGEIISIPDGNDLLDDEPTEAEIDREMAVNNWIADLGGHDDAALVVYELDPKTNKPVYIESLGAQEMDGPTLFQKLKNDYGGGKFRIQMRADGRIRKTQTVEVKSPPKVENHGNFGGMDLPGLIREIKGQSSGNDTQLILQMMQQQNQQFQQMITTLVTGMNQQPQVNPAEMQRSMLEGIAMMQKLAKPAETKDPTDLILKGIELATALKGDDNGGEANMYSLLQSAVKELGGTISEAAKVMPNMVAPQLAQKPPQPGQPQMRITADDTARPRDPVSGGDAPAPEIELQSRNEIPEQLKPFEPYVNSLVQMAAADKDPDLYAEVIIDQLGDEYAYAWVGARKGREMLLGIFTQAQPYAAWFEKVGNVIAEILNDSDDGNGENSGVDSPDEPPHNASDDKTLQPDGNVQDGSTTAHDNAADATSIDGDSERPGGDSSDVAIDGEVSEPVQDQSKD